MSSKIKVSEVRRLNAAGWTDGRIGALPQFGVSNQVIARIRERFGIPPVPRPEGANYNTNRPARERLLEYYRHGLTMDYVANQFGVVYNTLLAWNKFYEIDVRAIRTERLQKLLATCRHLAPTGIGAEGIGKRIGKPPRATQKFCQYHNIPIARKGKPNHEPRD